MTQGLFAVCLVPIGVGVYVRLSAGVRDGTMAHRTATTNARAKHLVAVMNLPRRRARAGDPCLCNCRATCGQIRVISKNSKHGELNGLDDYFLYI